MSSPHTEQAPPAIKRILLRSVSECTGWGAVLGAVYLPVGVYFFVGLSSRIDAGAWNTIDAIGAEVTWLGILGFVIGGAIGIVTGVVVGLTISLAVRRGASRRRQRLVGASTAAVAVGLMTGAIAVTGLNARDDAPIWELLIRPVWVVFSVVVPTVVAAGVIFWRTRHIAEREAHTDSPA